LSQNRSGRNAKRKLAHKIDKQTAKLISQADYFSSAGNPKHKDRMGDLTVLRSLRAEIRQQIAEKRLANWKDSLRTAAVLLGGQGCWQIYQEHHNEAVALGVAEDFRAAVVEAASKFFALGKGSVLAKKV
jgi:hypothetical protein